MTQADDKRLYAKTFETLAIDSPGRSAWSELLARSTSKTVFYLPGWLEAWHQSLGQGKTMAVVVVHCGELPVLAGAFTLSGKQIVFAGAGPTDYSQLLIDSTYAASSKLDPALDLLFRTARDTLPDGRWFRLGRMPTDGLTFNAMKDSKGGFRGVPTTSTVAPRMTMQNFAAALKKKSLRRHENGLKRRGSLDIKTYNSSAEISPLLPAFFDQHQRRWSLAGKVSQFTFKAEREFIRLCTQEMASVGAARFTRITSEGIDVAFHLGFSYDKVFTWYKPAFDPEYAKYSPGEVLLKALIEKATEENAEVFDFTIGGESFKHRFADQCPRVSYMNVSDSNFDRNLFRAKNRLRTLREHFNQTSSNQQGNSKDM